MANACGLHIFLEGKGVRAHRSGLFSLLPLGMAVFLLTLPESLAAAPEEPDAHDAQRFDAGVQQTGQKMVERIERLPRQDAKTIIRANMPKKETALTDLSLTMGTFRVEGNTDLPIDELNKILEPWQGRSLNFAEFEQVVHSVARHLREHGYPDASVVVSRTQIRHGVVAMAIQGLNKATTLLAMPQKPVEAELRVLVDEIKVTGVTVASAEEVQKVVDPWRKRALTAKEMEGVAGDVAALLRSKGVTLAQAYLPPQKLDSGVLEIAVQEGIVDGRAGHNGVVVTGAEERIHKEIVENFLANAVEAEKPLDTAKLETSLRLVEELPGVESVHSDLTPGSRPGTTQVEAKVAESNLVTGSLWADNFGSVYTGAERLNTLLNLNSPTGHGERLSITGSRASGMLSGKVAAQMPVGSEGARVGLSLSQMTLDIGREVAPLNLDSDTTVASLFGAYSLARGSKYNADLALNVDHKHLSNDMSGFRLNDRVVDMATLNYSGNWVDPWSGTVDWGLGLAMGHTDLSGNVVNQQLDASTVKTEGDFSKLVWNLGRRAGVLGSETLTYRVAANGQLANRNLDSAEKFQLGGPSGVRAYPVGEGLGDDGWLASLEVNHNLGPVGAGNLSVYTFLDAGGVTQYENLWKTALPNRPNTYTLEGFGFGTAWEESNKGAIRAVVAKPLGDNPNKTQQNTDSDGSNHDARLWIIGNINF
ncbi:MAG: hypothetical protein HQL87_10715 [Magnetococcales bacterium]|nr:hypothetical protein [Magnetococcales bacterium]